VPARSTRRRSRNQRTSRAARAHTIRALSLAELTGPDALELVDVPEPVAADGMVLIDVHAAGVSFPDLLLTRGEYQIRPDLPFTPGIEFAGVVRSGGDLAPGTRVAAAGMLGGFAEVAAAPAAMTFALPDALDFAQGAGFVMNYHTAYFALHRRGRLREGEVVLVHGAAGGVGTATIQVARAAGARVLAVTTGDEKAATAREAGADEVIDSAADWVAAVRERTAGRGADVVMDPVGGERFDQSLRAMAPEGRLLVVGFAGGTIPQLRVNRVLLRNVDVVGVNWGGFVGGAPDYLREAGDALAALAEAGAVRPIVGARYPLAEGARALHDLAERRALGKIVLEVR